MRVSRTITRLAECAGLLLLLAFTATIAAAAAPPHSLSGVVRDLAARPVPGARVTAALVSANGTIERHTVFTDEEGRFSVEFPPLLDMEPRGLDVTGFDVRASAPGFAPSGSRSNVARDGRALAPGGTIANVTLEPGAAVAVRVLSPDGTPAASASVRLVARDDGPRLERSYGFTDDDGRCDLRLERPGRFEVLADADRVGKAASGAFDVAAVDGRPGSDVDVGDLVLDPGGVIEAIVVLPDGSPVSGLLFRAASASAVPARPAGYGSTDDAGRLRIAGLDPGRYALVPTSLGNDDVPADAADRFPVLETGATAARVEAAVHVLTLRTRDASGNAIPGLAVFATRIDAERLPDFAKAWEKGDRRAAEDIARDCRFTCGMTLDPIGEGCLLFLEPGSAYFFRSRQPDKSAAPSIEPGFAFVRAPLVAGRSTVDLVPSASGEKGRVRLRVTDAAGDDVSARFVCTLIPRTGDLDTGGFRFIAPDADGLLPPLAPGPYQIGVEPDPNSPVCFAGYWGDCVVVAGQEALVSIVARPAARIRLRFVLPDESAGSLLRNVRARVAEGSVSLPVFDALATAGEMGVRFGEWILSRSAHAPGATTLSIEVDGYEKATREVTLEAGAVADVEIALERRR